MPRLVRKQPALALDASAKSSERSIGADHTVAWNDDRKRIAAVRTAHRARCGWLTDPTRELAVTQRLAVRNRAECGPHLALERRALCRQRQVELRALARKIFR